MSAQGDVFDPPRARASDPDTSHEAATSTREIAQAQRDRILAELSLQPMTADELDYVVGWRLTTAGRRLSELRRQGLVKRTHTQHKTRTGRWAYVYRLGRPK